MTQLTEIQRQMSELKAEMDRRHDDLSAKLGELRRKGDERHQENRERLDGLAQAILKFESVAASVSSMVTLLAENTRTTNETKVQVGSLVTLLNFGRGAMTLGQFVRKSIIWVTPMIACIAFLVAVVMWALGRGPFPPIGH